MSAFKDKGLSMSEIENILKFIDGNNSQPQPQPQQQQQPQPQQQQQPAPTPAPPPAIQIFGTSEFKLSDSITDQEYKKHLSTLNRLKKKGTYPCLFNSQVINSEDEMNAKRQSLMSQMRTIRTNRKNQTVKNTKLPVEELPEVADESELIQDGEAFYAKRNVSAVKDKNGRLRKVPATNPVDRKKIYEYVKNDKELLKQLIQEANPDTFRAKTSEKLNDELRDVYNMHADNDINKDETWTRDALVSYFKQQMKKQNSREGVTQRLQRKQVQQQQSMPYGLNPALFNA